MANKHIPPPMQPVPPHPGHMHGYAPRQPHYHGFCSNCCHPVAQCVCHLECRKVEKELLVIGGSGGGGDSKKNYELGTMGHDSNLSSAASIPDTESVLMNKKAIAMMDLITPVESVTAAEDNVAEVLDAKSYKASGISALRESVAAGRQPSGAKATVIGGGCCVHLSMEYMPLLPSAITSGAAFVGAVILDSKGTVLSWGKFFSDESHQVKECVISTNPGAYLTVIAVNAVARARWCEIISC